MQWLLLIAAILTTHQASGIKNSPTDVTQVTDVSGETSIMSDGSSGAVEQAEVFGDKFIPGHNRDDRISRPDRNFIITHEGILQYQPVARSLHDLDQEFKASSTFTRSEVIPIPNERSSGRALSDNTIGSSLINPDTQASYTSQDALSVPLHVGFQVEDPSPSALPAAPVGNLRMNPKGRVLSLEGDLNGASSQYRRRAVVARQPYAEGRQLVLQNPQAQHTSDMSLSETSYVPSLVYGQKVVSSAEPSGRATKLTSLYHQPAHHHDQAHAASSHYYRAMQPNQKFLNPHFMRSNDLEIAASDPRAAFEAFQNSNAFPQSGGMSQGGGFHQNNAAKDQSLDETKVYDVNAGGAKSYVDYMTAGDLESKKYLGGRYIGDVEDAGSEGSVPIHFGFQVEHPRIQYPARGSVADKYHSDHHVPTHHVPTKSGKFRIPKVPKTSKYIPSVEDVDEDDSDFKHIKIKKYSTNNDELSIPSAFSARYADESRHNFKYSSNQDPQPSTEILRSSATNEQQQFLPTQRSNQAHMKPSQYSPQGQASQRYYQYAQPPQVMRRTYYA